MLGKLNSVLELELANKHKKSALYLEIVHLKLSDIGSVINDAEEKQKFDEGVKIWLQKLENVVYDSNDLAD
ncbi:hypothetical protein REPUB_Repub05bG0136800 [Reevesia pubescens]